MSSVNPSITFPMIDFHRLFVPFFTSLHNNVARLHRLHDHNFTPSLRIENKTGLDFHASKNRKKVRNSQSLILRLTTFILHRQGTSSSISSLGIFATYMSLAERFHSKRVCHISIFHIFPLRSFSGFRSTT